ncbi:hypothetical protein Tsubulata_008428 [Turnera subulata]|uniref:CCT domain-containing protein n=1 Tax=Turnera subulata TaxID=218843 RepID=A0A9Q0FUW6_9ROSI|nr:hypothetical protein Tsubulata_008428 [Turnera subulata]
MSSDLYVLDPSFYHHSSPEMASSDGRDLFFPDPFSHFCDSSLEILQEFSDNQNTQYPVENSGCTDNLSPSILSSSPPSHQLENLTLYQTTHLQVPAANGYGDFSGLDALEVKTEECQVGFDSSYIHQAFMPHSYSGVENVAKMMQRSFSSNSFDGKPGFLFQPRFDTLLESPSYQSQGLSSPENNFIASHLRRVCSTGDLQNIRTSHPTQRSLSSPLSTESSSFIEEANFKVGRYSAEERKERISKYRAKRNQRNFTKTIKYACRKTLADNRPRIRGRFARNDETGEIPKAACSTRDDDEDELWFDGLHEEEDHIDGQTVVLKGSSSGAYDHSFGQPHQFQYYGY